MLKLTSTNPRAMSDLHINVSQIARMYRDTSKSATTIIFNGGGIVEVAETPDEILVAGGYKKPLAQPLAE